MTHSSVSPRPPNDEPPHGWGVLLAVLTGWGITLRLALLLCVPIAAIVGITALIAIYLGPIGVGALLTGSAGGGYGIKWFLVHHRRRRTARS